MKNIIVLISILFINSLSGFCQQKNKSLSDELDTYIQQQMGLHSIPGISSCIVIGNQIVYKSAFGTANFSTGTQVTLNTKFTLASISKLFTATACAQLWENGDIDIDADINNYLPFSIINPNFPDIPITVRQLLHHKSSLHDYESDLQLWDELGDPSISLSDFCQSYFIEGGSLYNASNWGNTAPGLSGYWYSNAGFTLLGFIVEEVSEMPFNQYCKENIQLPLEMNTAEWFYADMNIEEIAMPYNTSFEPYGYFSVPEYPAAMLKCDIEELANFLIAYTQRGNYNGFSLVNETTFENIVPNDMTNGFAWWGTDTWWGDPDGNYWSHGGFMNGVRTQLNYYPNDSTGLIILTNGEGSYTSIQNKLESYIPFFQDNNSEVKELTEFNCIVYPNPILKNSNLHFKFKGNIFSPIQIRITDISGRNISDYEINEDKLSINISSFSPGIYFMNIKHNNKLFPKKIIIY